MKTAETMTKGADISGCGKYRYALWRQWDWQGYANQVMFVGLNPSTADATQDDHTIRRCIAFAKTWGYGGMLMLNAYAYRATEPKVMMAAADPIGPGNAEALSYRRSQAGLIVAVWGNGCSSEREAEVCRILNTQIHCLGQTKSGRPKHPARLRSDTALEVFKEAPE